MTLASPQETTKYTKEEQLLYDCLLDRVQRESPKKILEDFRRLFIEGRGDQDAQVHLALEKMVKSKEVELSFHPFFNRCCHILINYWQNSQHYSAIPELVAMLENLAPARQGHYNTANQLRQLIKNFTLSDYYVKLQRLARIVSSKYSDSSSVGTLINRYPYLYNHYLLSDESSREHLQTVRHIKLKTERRFEVNLSHYVTYKVRLAQLSTNSAFSAEGGRIIQPVENPTLLSDRELNRTFQQYIDLVASGPTYRSLSQSLISQTAYTPTYQAFKNELYEYLVTSADYGKGQFNRKLYDVLQNTLPQCNHQKLSEFLVLRTSRQLLNYLVVESAQKPEHYIFLDLITNIGVIRTVGLLLKLVLMCRQVKPDLEKRISILFNHYEGFERNDVPWLIKSLENLQVGFSIHFGKADLSVFKTNSILSSL